MNMPKTKNAGYLNRLDIYLFVPSRVQYVRYVEILKLVWQNSFPPFFTAFL